jgi:hypothetical protein
LQPLLRSIAARRNDQVVRWLFSVFVVPLARRRRRPLQKTHFWS